MLNNKLIQGLVGVTVLSALAPAAFASHWFKCPYLGIEVIQTNQNYKANFGEYVFKKNPQDYSVYAGFNINRYFGVEGGYEFQPKRNRTATLTAGQSMPGGTILTAGDADTVNSSIQGTHPYLGLFLQADQKFHNSWVSVIKWQALVAASFSHVWGSAQVTAIDGIPFAGTNFTYSKSKIVAMAKVGATTYFTPHVGLRISVDYRNLSQIQMPANTGTGLAKLKDTWGVGLGLTYLFF